jgi:hypothetical protein
MEVVFANPTVTSAADSSAMMPPIQNPPFQMECALCKRTETVFAFSMVWPFVCLRCRNEADEKDRLNHRLEELERRVSALEAK